MIETGTVKAIVAGKGFGFVTPSDRYGGDVFFHVSGLNGLAFDQSLVGREVEFIAGVNPRTGKPCCQVVQPIGYDSLQSTERQAIRGQR